MVAHNDLYDYCALLTNCQDIQHCIIELPFSRVVLSLGCISVIFLFNVYATSLLSAHMRNLVLYAGQLFFSSLLNTISGTGLQLDCFSWRRTRIINLPANQKGYDTFETTVGKLSTRRIQIYPDYFCLGIILKVILNNFQNNA